MWALLRHLVPGHSVWLVPLMIAFMAVNSLTRVVLALMNGDVNILVPSNFIACFGIGLCFDLTVLTISMAGIVLILSILPAKKFRFIPWFVGIVSLPLSTAIVFTALSEIIFWNEFTTRFNFIAVDYLVFRTEVIGNIRESYNLALLLGTVAGFSLCLWIIMLWRLVKLEVLDSAIRHRLGAALCWICLALSLFAITDASLKQHGADSRLNELAGNGYYDFVHAFFNNEIDYDQFYATRTIVDPQSFQHDVRPDQPIQKRHLLLVSVESLSASFLGSYGAQTKLTPYLDTFSQESLRFTHFYATGTRTVRGLEAISMGIPPTPGHAIVRRPGAHHLQTLGQVLADQGWQSVYLYGGYSYFDSMQDYFGHNGYEVIDRKALTADQISHETIWGVADEDLFAQSLREMNRRVGNGETVFMHIMTTSNHRPFTYPEGRIDIPSKTGRDGAVKYTDFAIGKWLEGVKQQAWYKDAVIVILADHTHMGRGKAELPPANYHIPLLIHAPGLIKPGNFDPITSQIDLAPTLLGLLQVPYSSRFFGQDALKDGENNQRAYFANQQTVGLYRNGRVVELYPNRRIRVVDAESNRELNPQAKEHEPLVDEAIRSYQSASYAFKHDLLKRPPGPQGKFASR